MISKYRGASWKERRRHIKLSPLWDIHTRLHLLTCKFYAKVIVEAFFQQNPLIMFLWNRRKQIEEGKPVILPVILTVDS